MSNFINNLKENIILPFLYDKWKAYVSHIYLNCFAMADPSDQFSRKDIVASFDYVIFAEQQIQAAVSLNSS